MESNNIHVILHNTAQKNLILSLFLSRNSLKKITSLFSIFRFSVGLYSKLNKTCIFDIRCGGREN